MDHNLIVNARMPGGSLPNRNSISPIKNAEEDDQSPGQVQNHDQITVEIEMIDSATRIKKQSSSQEKEDESVESRGKEQTSSRGGGQSDENPNMPQLKTRQLKNTESETPILNLHMSDDRLVAEKFENKQDLLGSKSMS